MKGMYVKRISISLIMVALIAGMAGCGDGSDGGLEYTSMIAASTRHTVGLKSDGTVVAVGSNSDGQSDSDARTLIS